MDNQVSGRIIAIISLPLTGKAHNLMNALRAPLAKDGHCFHLHLPSRLFPSSWGSVTRNVIATPQQPETGAPEPLTTAELAELQAWVQSGQINLIPAGYAGSLHAVLNTEEIKAETEWSVSNPWRTGIKDNFGQAPDIIIPFWSDPHRPRLLAETASRFGFAGLGILEPELVGPAKSPRTDGPNHHKSSGHFLIFAARDHANDLCALPWLNIRGETSARAIQQQIENHLASHKTCDLIVRLEPNEDCSDVGLFLQALEFCAGQGHLCTAAILPQNLAELGIDQRKAEIEAGELLPLADLNASMNPDFRWQISRLPEGRRGRSATQERLRTQLLSSVPGEVPAKITIQSEPPTKQRSLLAMMQGSATIMADDFEARFHEGKFTGFYRHAPQGEATEAIRFIPSIGMCLRHDYRTMAMETESAVSFETDYTRGLRETLVLRNEQTRIPGRVIADFMVADRSRHIILDVQIRYPWFAKTSILDEVRPVILSIALPASTGKTGVNIAWKRQDGSDCLTRLCYPGDYAPQDHYWNLLDSKMAGHLRTLVDRVRKLTGGGSVVDTGSWQEQPGVTLFGAVWTISWSDNDKTRGLQICRLPDESKQSVPFEVRLRPDSRNQGLVLEIFPEGRYRHISSDDLRNLTHHFVLGLYPLFDEESVPPPMDDMIDREVQPFFMIREG